MPALSLPRSGLRVRERYVQNTTHTMPVLLSKAKCLDPRIRSRIHHTSLIGIDKAIANGYLS